MGPDIHLQGKQRPEALWSDALHESWQHFHTHQHFLKTLQSAVNQSQGSKGFTCKVKT